MGIEIVEISSDDRPENIDGLISLLVEQMKVLGNEVAPEEIERSVANALKPESRGRFFVAHDEDDEPSRPAGVCFINVCSGIEAGGDYVWVNEIHTCVSRRSQGVGRALVAHVVDWARRHDCRYIAGITSLRNRAARNLFVQFGFNDAEVIWLDKTL